MNPTIQDLVDNANAAIRDPNWRTSDGSPADLEHGWCARVVRKIIQKTCGSRFDAAVVAPDSKHGSAIHMAHRFLDQGWGFLASKLSLNGGLKLGDILFKTQGSGGFGHVALYVGNGMVAENSSTQYGRIRGALGYRTLEQFGAFQVVGRLPLPLSRETAPTQISPTSEPKLVIIPNTKAGGQQRILIQSSHIVNNKFVANASELGAALLSERGEVEVRGLMDVLGIRAYQEDNELKDAGRYELYI